MRELVKVLFLLLSMVMIPLACICITFIVTYEFCWRGAADLFEVDLGDIRNDKQG